MPIKPINNLSPDWFTPDSEKDETMPTRFKIKPLDGEQYMSVMLETKTDPDGNLSLSSAGMNMALKYGLVGWENFDTPFSKANFGKIPAIVLISIASEIVNRSTLGGEQEKN